MNLFYQKISSTFAGAFGLSLVGALIIGVGLYITIRSIDSGAQARVVADAAAFFGLWVALFPLLQWGSRKIKGETLSSGQSFSGHVIGAALSSLLYLGLKLALA